jgi:hypothetical protein
MAMQNMMLRLLNSQEKQNEIFECGIGDDFLTFSIELADPL